MKSAFAPWTLTSCGFAIALVLAVSTPAAAQQGGADTSGSGTLGPVGITPRITWHTGYDDNLFRSSVPVSDIISTIGGSTDLRGRTGRVDVTARGAADWVHYAKVVSERGANAEGSLRLDFLLNRIAPYVSGSYRNTRQRVNPEIDGRPRVQMSTFAAGSIVHLGGKTAIDVAASRSLVAYHRDAETDGIGLYSGLNRAADRLGLTLRRDVTPETHITVGGEMSRHQFDTASARNGDDMRLSTGFASTGRLRGHAIVGVRVLKLVDSSLAPSPSRGLFVSVGTSTVLKDRVQIGVDGARDVAPSYRSGIGYYDYFSYGTAITCAVRRSLRLSAQIGRRLAEYPGLEILATSQPEKERETTYGSGISYLIGRSMAIDLAGTYTSRTSAMLLRQFDSVSVSVGVSHAF